MADLISYYKLLEIPENATQEEIKHAYRKQALRHHPDQNSNSPESQTRFILISNAYDTLSDPQKRKEYDDCLLQSRVLRGKQKSAGPQGHFLTSGEGYSSYDALLNHFNFILWDIEDWIRDRVGSNNVYGQNLLMVLAFIDQWVLTPAGFRDYFMEARQMKGLKPTDYLRDYFNPANTAHRSFVSMSDYFYNIRKRMDRFISKTRMSDLFAPLQGYDVRLIDCIMEAQNYAIHILGGLSRMRDGTQSGISPFAHSRPCFQL